MSIRLLEGWPSGELDHANAHIRANPANTELNQLLRETFEGVSPALFNRYKIADYEMFGAGQRSMTNRDPAFTTSKSISTP